MKTVYAVKLPLARFNLIPIQSFIDVETKGSAFALKDVQRSKALSVMNEELRNVSKERESL